MAEETKQDKILRQVRALIAKANATDFPEERATFQAKADQLMEAYAIETWQLQQGQDDTQAKLITKRDMDMSWWDDTRGVHTDARWEIWWLFEACVRHCRCYTSWTVQEHSRINKTHTIRVYGLESDLNYLDLLFTDLFIQLFGKIRPTYDPNKSLGENCWVAKEAGMSWEQIARWAGMPEKITTAETYNNRTGSYVTKTNVDGMFVRHYKKWCEEHGLERRVVHPDAWAVSFTESFCHRIRVRLAEMSDYRAQVRGEGDTGSTAIALRDIRQAAQEALYCDFPDLRPHPSDCKCEQCTAKRKPVKYRAGHRTVYAATAQGDRAGQTARIANRDPAMRGRKEIEG